MHGIEQDHNRFRQIIKGKIREGLRKYISHGDILGKRGKDKISIPLPRINLPRFVYNSKHGGVGQGDGRGAGNNPADNPIEVDVSLEEMADLLGEELKLPRIEPKGKNDIADSKKYNTIQRVGPESLRSFKKTYKEALKRAIVSGDYDPDNPNIIPIKDDRRYRASKPIQVPQSQAVIFYIMDVSGSMEYEEKHLARLTSFWIDLWLRKNYKNIQSRYIIHHINAKEVDQHTFYHIREGGGTRISSAYELCSNILSVEYNIADWNVYIFQYSDGDDWSKDSGQIACDIIKRMLPDVNQVAYCQVKNKGSFLDAVESNFAEENKVVWSVTDKRSRIYDTIKEFFVQGH